jgi:hypothetical protein
MKLKDCFEAFAQKFCPGLTVKSEFFQINPDVVTATNYVTGQPSKVRNIVVFQKSDVKRPAVSGNATIANVSWEKFINAVKEIFNAQWRVEGSVLRIEHISYFSKAGGLNLTLPKYSEFVFGLEKYTYKTEEIPQREVFTFMEASAGDFAGLPIEYTGGCAGKSIKTHAVDFVTTDVELCMNNPASDSGIVEDKGLVFIACSPTNIILSEAPILGTTTKLNNSLGWAQLHRDYHKYYRALKAGVMNGHPTQFLSVRPLKKGATITVPLCCDDVFNPDDLVTTALGDGTVEKATYNFLDSTVALDLLYPSDLALYVPAIAVNDMASAVAGVPTPLGVLSNDIPSPSEPITIIEIVMAPSHGTAVVIAGPDIRYTSAAGYFGSDNLVYRVKGAAGVPSNNALVAIDSTSGLFVRLTFYNQQFDSITGLCGGSMALLGEQRKASYKLEFFTDAGATTPIDTTGMGLAINVRLTGIYGDPSNAPTASVSAYAASGTSMVILLDYPYFRDEFDCSGVRVDYRDESISIDPGPYNVI